MGPRSVAQVGKQDLVPHLCWHLLAVPLTGANTRALSASPEGWWQPVWLFPWLKAECFPARVWGLAVWGSSSLCQGSNSEGNRL